MFNPKWNRPKQKILPIRTLFFSLSLCLLYACESPSNRQNVVINTPGTAPQTTITVPAVAPTTLPVTQPVSQPVPQAPAVPPPVTQPINPAPVAQPVQAPPAAPTAMPIASPLAQPTALPPSPTPVPVSSPVIPSPPPSPVAPPPPANPVVSSFSPTSAEAGAAVTLTGDHLTGATEVKFNGVKAEFSVLSATQIRATVPPGVGKGLIAVTTPAGNTTAANPFNQTLSMNFASIPAGAFTMGAAGWAVPTFPVTLSAFQLQTTEVTQKLWWDVMGAWPGNAPSSADGKGDNYPMYNVSFCDIVGASGDSVNCGHVPQGQSFLDKLNTQFEGKYRLPTEAEWEYAARAGTTNSQFACGNYVEFNNGANANSCPYLMEWFYDNSPDGAKTVGQKQANAFGLYDMQGNVAEWVSDRFGPYTADAKNNPTGPSSGDLRVTRGGSWVGGAQYSHVAGRPGPNTSATRREKFFGFRLVRMPG